MGLQIQDGGLIATRLQSFLRLTGRVAPELEAFVLPMIVVGDLSAGGLPPIRRHVSIDFTIAGVVNERALWSMEAPPGVVGLITNMHVIPAAQNVLTVNFSSTITATDVPDNEVGVFTDNRLRFGERLEEPAIVIQAGTRGAVLVGHWSKTMPTSPQVGIEPVGWLCGSGVPVQFGFLEFGMSAANDTTQVTMEWDEFQLF